MAFGLLLDLDGTLLDIDIDAFLRRYFEALSVAVAELVPERSLQARTMDAIMTATGTMTQPHPGRTNRDVFYQEFRSLTGIDLNEQWCVFERFYDDVFPTLGHGIGPAKGARQVLTAARSCGARVVIATNPIFPLRAIEHRLAWAGISLADVDAVTSYETSHACKPQASYFREAAMLAEVAPERCLMVGDDVHLDLPAAQVGMRTFYVGAGSDGCSDYRGDLEDLVRLLPDLCA